MPTTVTSLSHHKCLNFNEQLNTEIKQSIPLNNFGTGQMALLGTQCIKKEVLITITQSAETMSQLCQGYYPG